MGENVQYIQYVNRRSSLLISSLPNFEYRGRCTVQGPCSVWNGLAGSSKVRDIARILPALLSYFKERHIGLCIAGGEVYSFHSHCVGVFGRGIMHVISWNELVVVEMQILVVVVLYIIPQKEQMLTFQWLPVPVYLLDRNGTTVETRGSSA